MEGIKLQSSPNIIDKGEGEFSKDFRHAEIGTQYKIETMLTRGTEATTIWCQRGLMFLASSCTGGGVTSVACVPQCLSFCVYLPLSLGLTLYAFFLFVCNCVCLHTSTLVSLYIYLSVPRSLGS